MRFRPAQALDLDILAQIHAACFAAAAWPAQEIAALLSGPGGYGVVGEPINRREQDEGGKPRPAPVAFILCRIIADDAEILTLAVAPGCRRRGGGRALLQAAAALAQGAGARSLFLEVAADNDPAIALYEAAGFERAGLRRGYYAKGRSTPVDALVYRRALNSDAG